MCVSLDKVPGDDLRNAAVICKKIFPSLLRVENFSELSLSGVPVCLKTADKQLRKRPNSLKLLQ